MYLCGYSLDNLSLMALTISTGFVVDDAIVVIENITRYLEAGMSPFAAALKGAKEIGSTVVTMSISLVAVFIPLLLMGGIVGRLLREFAVTLSVAIAGLHGGLAHGHAHDVRAPAAGSMKRTAGCTRRWKTSSTGSCGLYGRIARGGAAPFVRHPAGSAGHHRPECVPVHARAQGILPAAGQRSHERADPGRPGHLLSVHGQDPAADGQHRGRRSRGRYRQRLYRRRRRGRRRIHHQPGAHVRVAQAARRAQDHGGFHHAAAAPEAGQDSRRDALPAGLAGPARGRTQQRGALSVHHARRQSDRI